MSDDRHVRRDGEDYGTAFLTLLPQGQAWPKYPGTTLDLACRGLAEYWGYVDGRAADLLEIESDPRKTTDRPEPPPPDGLLDDWERNWGLPDPCEVYPPETQEARQDELVYKMTLLGAQNRQFFIDLAERKGQTVTIREYAPYMCGVSWVGDSRNMDPTTGEVNDPPVPGADPYFRWQLGRREMRYYWLVDLENVLTGVECIFTRYKPGHSDVVFTYRSRLDRSIGLYPWLMA